MNLSGIWSVLSAVQKGKELGNVALWKNVSACTVALIAFINALLPFLKSIWPDMPDVTEENVRAIAYGISTLGGVLVGFWTMATSKRVGIGG